VEPVVVNLPPVNDLFAELASQHNTIYSSLDIISFFWQIPLHPNSRPYTTITSPATGQKWMWKTCPFGLANSSAYSILCLQACLSRLIENRMVFTYVDDCIIGTTTYNTHINHVREFLKQLRAANLSLNSRKCTFLDDHAIFLSHRIDANGYSMITKYSTDVIRNFASPKDPKALARYISFLSWYRKEIPGFAKRVGPLRQLLRKDVRFLWTEEHETIFRELNDLIISPPILRPIDPTSRVYILCDASTHGTSWTICQKDNNRLYPCYFGGQATNTHQARWNAYELEIFAAVQCLQTHYNILLGREITIMTDCASLHHWNTLHLGTNRLRRWHHLLSQFHLEIIHLPGVSHTLSDTISRMFEQLTPDQRMQFTPQPHDDTDDYILATHHNPPLIEHSQTPLQSPSIDTPTDQDLNDNDDDSTLVTIDIYLQSLQDVASQ